MTLLLFSARPGLWEVWAPALRDALAQAGVAADLVAGAAPETVDYIAWAPRGPVQDFTPYTRLRAVFGLWAGVEAIAPNPTLTVPLTRMVDPGLTEGMRDYVLGHVLRHHLGMDAHVLGQDGVWRGGTIPPLARDRTVGVLGLGALGAACAAALAGLGFRVLGWARTAKTIPGVACHHGEAGRDAVLAAAEILVLLLPLTPATETLLDAARLARLPRGAVIVNPGRGGLIDDAALIAALDAGQIGHATLDVFRTEPLPPGHPFWAHPRVTVTPHIASETRPESAARVIAENLRRAEAGAPLLHEVDRKVGY
jgi:glyoxylate/hydroxypyruvate reductase